MVRRKHSPFRRGWPVVHALWPRLSYSSLLIFGGYAPGLITALAINAPFAVYCFSRAARERWFSRGALLAPVPAALALHGPVLLAGLWLAATLSR